MAIPRIKKRVTASPVETFVRATDNSYETQERQRAVQGALGQLGVIQEANQREDLIREKQARDHRVKLSSLNAASKGKQAVERLTGPEFEHMTPEELSQEPIVAEYDEAIGQIEDEKTRQLAIAARKNTIQEIYQGHRKNAEFRDAVTHFSNGVPIASQTGNLDRMIDEFKSGIGLEAALDSAAQVVAANEDLDGIETILAREDVPVETRTWLMNQKDSIIGTQRQRKSDAWFAERDRIEETGDIAAAEAFAEQAYADGKMTDNVSWEWRQKVRDRANYIANLKTASQLLGEGRMPSVIAAHTGLSKTDISDLQNDKYQKAMVRAQEGDSSELVKLVRGSGGELPSLMEADLLRGMYAAESTDPNGDMSEYQRSFELSMMLSEIAGDDAVKDVLKADKYAQFQGMRVLYQSYGAGHALRQQQRYQELQKVGKLTHSEGWHVARSEILSDALSDIPEGQRGQARQLLTQHINRLDHYGLTQSQITEQANKFVADLGFEDTSGFLWGKQKVGMNAQRLRTRAAQIAGSYDDKTPNDVLDEIADGLAEKVKADYPNIDNVYIEGLPTNPNYVVVRDYENAQALPYGAMHIDDLIKVYINNNTTKKEEVYGDPEGRRKPDSQRTFDLPISP